MEAIAHGERLRPGVQEYAGAEGPRRQVVESVPEPPDVSQVIDGRGGGGFDLNGDHGPVPSLHDQVDLSSLVFPVVEQVDPGLGTG